MILYETYLCFFELNHYKILIHIIILLLLLAILYTCYMIQLLVCIIVMLAFLLTLILKFFYNSTWKSKKYRTSVYYFCPNQQKPNHQYHNS